MRSLFFMTLLLTPILPMAQLAPPDCEDLHTGVFYYYSQVDNNHGVYIREEGVQKEINLETGDTALWNISWENDCRYLLTYVSGNKLVDATSGETSQKPVLNVQITAVTPAYYLYQAVVPEKKSTVLASDTLWRVDQPAKLVRKNISEASFPGGLSAWQKYLIGFFSDHQKEVDKMRKIGVCYVQFVVDTDGKVSAVTALSMKGTALAKIAVEAIKNGPDWLPAIVDGTQKKMVKIQPIALQVK